MNNPETYSQNGQDRYVADTFFRGMRNGFFVEAGAGDGLWISNTLLLERRYGWRGILVEPTRAFEDLVKNRPDAICDNSCLASTRKTVTLVEIADLGQAALSPGVSGNLLLSRTVDVSPADPAELNSYWGRAQKQYEREALPLAEVLAKHAAPARIDRGRPAAIASRPRQ